jgi:hypothetical protein
MTTMLNNRQSAENVGYVQVAAEVADQDMRGKFAGGEQK